MSSCLFVALSSPKLVSWGLMFRTFLTQVSVILSRCLAHQEEAAERMERRAWARRAIEEEQRQRVHDQFLHQLTNTQWFADTISSFCEKYVGWKHLKRNPNC